VHARHCLPARREVRYALPCTQGDMSMSADIQAHVRRFLAEARRMRSSCLRTYSPSFWASLLAAALCVCMAALVMAAEAPATKHPLEPLRKEEITTTVEVLKASGKVSDGSRFPIIVLHDPPKDEGLHFTRG